MEKKYNNEYQLRKANLLGKINYYKEEIEKEKAGYNRKHIIDYLAKKLIKAKYEMNTLGQ